MIILRQDRELVSVPDWRAVVALPGYSDNVDPKTVKLKEIIGSYYLPDEVPCGLTCREPHKRGYVVATESGTVTNLGHMCGKRHFPDADFDQMRRIFDREVRMRTHRQTLTAFKLRIPELAGQIEELRIADSQGADWVHRCVDRLKTPGHGIDSIRLALAKMLKAADPRIRVTRRATKEERDAAEVRERKEEDQQPAYVEEIVGRVAGLEVLADENDLRQILIVDLATHLAEIAALDVEAASESTLQRESAWSAQVDDKLERAVDAIASGHIFLTKRNLRQLEFMLENDRERAAFRGAVQDLPLGDQVR